MNDAELLRSFGYDPADPVPRDAAGERIFPDRLLEDLAAAPLLDEAQIGSTLRQRSEEYPLTVAETEVLTLLSCGHSTGQVAALLGKSSHTVKAQVRTACRQLGAASRLQAVAEAIRRGLIP